MYFEDNCRDFAIDRKLDLVVYTGKLVDIFQDISQNRPPVDKKDDMVVGGQWPCTLIAQTFFFFHSYFPLYSSI